MRRFLLVLTLICFAGWSQPAQQAQPPIVVEVKMPSESIWTALFKVAIPTILGAALGSGITLYGVRQTNKHNAAENKANRLNQLQIEKDKAEIAAKYKSQDRRWDFRKEMYVKLLADIDQFIALYAEAYEFQSNQTLTPDITVRLLSACRQISTSANLAPLAGADTLLPIVASTMSEVTTEKWTFSRENLRNMNALLERLKQQIQVTGRKDLWAASEPEPTAESTKQT